MTDVLDLFRGAGGFSVALHQLGLTDHGVENNKPANATAEAAGFTTVWQDVRTLDPADCQGYHGLCAGPPCQPFSVSGHGAGRQALDIVFQAIKLMSDGTWPAELLASTGDERTELVVEPLRFALVMQPDWIVLEQVPTVLPVWEAIAVALREHGYHVWVGCLRAEMYGTPQTRRRAVLLARKSGPVSPPAPTHSQFYPRDPGRLDPGVLPWVSMAEALGWGLTKRPATTVVSRTHTKDRTTGGPGNPRPLDGGAGAREVYRRAVASGDWAWLRPSPTIVGSFRPDIVAAPRWRKAGDGPRQKATGSVQLQGAWEAGVLQDFDKNYPWQGTKNQQYQQAGNSIPVRLAEACIRAVLTD